MLPIIHGHNGLVSSGKHNYYFFVTKPRPLKFINTNYRVDYGHEEVKLKFGKDPRQYSITTKEFLDDGNGNIKGVNTIQVEWTKSATGQWQMQEIAGTEKHFPADLVLLAMGFIGPEKKVPTDIGKLIIFSNYMCVY